MLNAPLWASEAALASLLCVPFVPSSGCGWWHTGDPSVTPMDTARMPPRAASAMAHPLPKAVSGFFPFQAFPPCSGVAVGEVTQSSMQLILGFNYKPTLWKASDELNHTTAAQPQLVSTVFTWAFRTHCVCGRTGPECGYLGKGCCWCPTSCPQQPLALQFDPLSFSLVAQPNPSLRRVSSGCWSPQEVFAAPEPHFL